eukprot:g24871.t2
MSYQEHVEEAKALNQQRTVQERERLKEEAAKAEAEVPLEILQDLHLDPRAAQLLGKSFDLLVMLVVASQTHVHTKARFAFAMCTSENFLDYPSFRQILSSFLRAVWRLGSGTRRPESASPALLDSLAFCLFRPHEPALSQEAFMRMATEDQVGAMDLLATALDVELHQLAQGDPNLISETIEAASNPWHHDEFVESLERTEVQKGEQVAERVRLVRLYWRFLVGSVGHCAATAGRPFLLGAKGWQA